MLFPGEEKAIQNVLEAGEQYGYGNMIAYLKKAWAEHLIREYEFPVETAINAADTEVYLIEEVNYGTV